MPRPTALVVAAESLSPEHAKRVAEHHAPEPAFLRVARFLRADLLTLDSFRPSIRGQGENDEGYAPLRATKGELPAFPTPVTANAQAFGFLGHEARRRAVDYDLIVFFGSEAAIGFLRHGATASVRVVVLADPALPLAPLLPLHQKKMGPQVAKLVTFSPLQHLYATERLRLPPERVELIPLGVDHRFFKADAAVERVPERVVVRSRSVDSFAMLEAGVRAAGGQLVLSQEESGGDAPEQKRRTALSAAEVALVSESPSESCAGTQDLLEAMACGCATVAARTRGLEHLLRDEAEGLYVTPGKAEEWRAALKRLLGDPDRAQRMGRAARTKIEETLTLAHFANRVGRICQAAADGNRESPEFHLIPSHVAVAEEAGP